MTLMTITFEFSHKKKTDFFKIEDTRENNCLIIFAGSFEHFSLTTGKKTA